MKQPLRFFSIGLITASIILFIVMSFVGKPASTPNEMKTDDMITAIKDEGYHVLSASEYITLATNTEQDVVVENENTNENKEVLDEKEDKDKVKDEEDKNNSEENKEKEKEKEKEPEVISYTLNVKQNMLGPEISEILEKNKIIKNADDFNRYLETEGYAPYIQLRKSKLNSNMSHYEIAEAIARKK